MPREGNEGGGHPVTGELRVWVKRGDPITPGAWQGEERRMRVGVKRGE